MKNAKIIPTHYLLTGTSDGGELVKWVRWNYEPV